jgi:DNA-binding transcriptional LysR family regulator
MDWQQFLYFKRLSEVQNISRAADELGLTQSALSRSISKLEEELGVPLFERKSRGVILNPYGKSFLVHVNRVLQEIIIAKQELMDMIDPLNGTISLAFIPTLGVNFVPDIIGEFREKFPNINFQLTQDRTKKIISQLDFAEIDLGFCAPNEEVENISTIPVVNEELFLIVPKNHTLSQQKHVNLEEVANEPFVIYKHESVLREVIDRLCHDAGFKPIIAFEGVEDTTIAGLVAANFGIALIPYLPGLDLSKVSILRICEPKCRRLIYMAWRTNGYMSPAAVHFKDFVLEKKSKIGLSNR